MRKTNAALLEEIARLEAELTKVRMHNTKQAEDLRTTKDDLYRHRNDTQWQKNLNDRLITAIVNLSGKQGSTERVDLAARDREILIKETAYEASRRLGLTR